MLLEVVMVYSPALARANEDVLCDVERERKLAPKMVNGPPDLPPHSLLLLHAN